MITTHRVKIQEPSFEQQPREKLSQFGAGVLDNTELLSLLIGTQNSQKSPMETARALLKKYGSIAALGALPAELLAQEPGLGPAKAAALTAAYELGVRVSREQINSSPLDSPERIYTAFAPQMQHLAQEQVWVISVDTRVRHLGTTIVSKGTVNESMAHPREVLRPVITRAAHGFILLHNHPSGDPSPSHNDESVTKSIVAAANLMQIRFLDHIIIGRPVSERLPYYSFREAGMIL